jgi:hypothetical protein
MSDLSHERDRLIALVDDWIAGMEGVEIDDARIDHAVIAATVSGENAENDPVEGVYSRWTTTRVHVQVGVVRLMSLYLEGRAQGED